MMCDSIFGVIIDAGIITSTTKNENERELGGANPLIYKSPALKGGDTGVGRCDKTSVISLNQTEIQYCGFRLPTE